MYNLRNLTSVYVMSGNRFLLLYRQGSRVVNDMWIGTAGGHFEQDELNEPRCCALRELNEETGLCESDIDNLRLRYITLRAVGGEIRQNYYYFAELKSGVDENIKSNEGVLRWFNDDELSSLPMPHTSKFVTEHYLQTGCKTDSLYLGAVGENGIDFSVLDEF